MSRQFLSAFRAWWSAVRNDRTLGLIILTTLLVRVLTILWGCAWFDFGDHPDHSWTTLWSRWDAIQYLRVAEWGYQADGAAAVEHSFRVHFLPAYPVLLRFSAAILPFQRETLAIVLSIAFNCAAAVLLFRLTQFETKSPQIAWNSTVLMLIYPTSYFANAVYAESLFMFAMLATIYALRVNQSIFLAGIAAAIAILTKTTGIIAALLVGASFVMRFRSLSRLAEMRPREVVGVGLPCVAGLLYLWINLHYYGHSWFFLTEYAGNPYSLDFGGDLLETARMWSSSALNLFSRYNDTGFMTTHGWATIFLLATLIISLFSLRALPAIYSLYSFSMLALLAEVSWPIGMGRWTLPIFPVFMTVASWPRIAYRGVCVLFLSGLLYFSRIFSQGGFAF